MCFLVSSQLFVIRGSLFARDLQMSGVKKASLTRHACQVNSPKTEIHIFLSPDIWELQSGSLHPCSRPLINSQIALFSGVGTPAFSPHFTIAPFMKSTSV